MIRNWMFFVLATVLFTSCAKTIANFSYQEGKKQAPAKIVFENKSKNATRYEWDFGDGNKSTDTQPTHEYKSSGNYTVILKVYKGKRMASASQKLNVEQPANCLVELETKFGTMVIELSNLTPLHRDNFLKLVEEGYYNDLLFHRVINGFMVQGGDPNSKGAAPNIPLGTGGPTYRIPAEFVDDLVHVKGALAAARMGDGVNPKKESSGSQFYIVQGRPVTEQQLEAIENQKNFHYSPDQKKLYLEVGGTPFLDRDYTVFGRVIKGLDVIDKIAAVQTQRGDRPVEDVKMKIKSIK